MNPPGILHIPASLTEIEDRAFSNRTGLTELHFPASLTTISFHAFGHCTGLTELHFPASLTTIGRAAFTVCTGLTELVGVGQGLPADEPGFQSGRGGEHLLDKGRGRPLRVPQVRDIEDIDSTMVHTHGDDDEFLNLKMFTDPKMIKYRCRLIQRWNEET